jgi:hypothetical protein
MQLVAMAPNHIRSFLTDLVLDQPDDELDLPYLAGFEWDKEESWTRLVVHLSKDAGAGPSGKKKKKSEE